MAINARTFVSLCYGDVKNFKVFLEKKGALTWAHVFKHTAVTFSHEKTAFLEEADAQGHIDAAVQVFLQYNTKTKEV